MARRTPRLVIACVVLALPLVGCGGDPTAFSAATDRTCREVGTAVDGLRRDLVRTRGATEDEALARAVTRYVAAVRIAAGRLAAVDPPEGERGFRDGTVSRLRRHADALAVVASAAEHGRVTAALADGLDRAGPAAMPEIPDAVREHAPACRTGVR